MEQKTEFEKKPRTEERVVRVLSKDIEGGMTVYAGLTKIKGVSWSLANAVCNILKIDKRRKIGSLSEDEIKRVSEFIKNPGVPSYLMNRRKDFETGQDKHFQGSDLELRQEFDIKRLKKIRSYRGIRHGAGLPLRGQRTKSHFRKNRNKSGGIKGRKKQENEKKA